MRKIIRFFKRLKTLDKYILIQIIEMFLLGVFIFTAIIFASDTFITLIKQISKYGIPFKVALIMIILNLPSVFVMTIPMGVLLSTVMTLNKLSLASEITVMRSCGIGLNRIAKPIFIFAIIMSMTSFFINETIVPVAAKRSKDLALWAFGQKNIPNGKQNFMFKETGERGLKRLFYVGHCEDSVLYNISVLDISKPDTIQVLQARYGSTSPEGWEFEKGAVYTVSDKGKILNTTFFEHSVAQFGMDLSNELEKNVAKEHNFLQLLRYLSSHSTLEKEKYDSLKIELYDKIALPITTIVFVLIGVPLAITPPRVRYNRGFLFSILIIFFYYLIRALSISFGETGTIPPFIAAWLPNIIIATLGIYLYKRKVYTIT
ncbi:LptF/LptG family permease [bacterium]|nr:LptF/LptG family permease [bacterium]